MRDADAGAVGGRLAPQAAPQPCARRQLPLGPRRRSPGVAPAAAGAGQTHPAAASGVSGGTGAAGRPWPWCSPSSPPPDPAMAEASWAWAVGSPGCGSAPALLGRGLSLRCASCCPRCQGTSPRWLQGAAAATHPLAGSRTPPALPPQPRAPPGHEGVKAPGAGPRGRSSLSSPPHIWIQ